MVVGQYESLGVDNNARTQDSARLPALIRSIKKSVEEVLKRILPPRPRGRTAAASAGRSPGSWRCSRQRVHHGARWRQTSSRWNGIRAFPACVARPAENRGTASRLPACRRSGADQNTQAEGHHHKKAAEKLAVTSPTADLTSDPPWSAPNFAEPCPDDSRMPGL